MIPARLKNGAPRSEVPAHSRRRSAKLQGPAIKLLICASGEDKHLGHLVACLTLNHSLPTKETPLSERCGQTSRRSGLIQISTWQLGQQHPAHRRRLQALRHKRLATS
jgi:hypothetical protein